jgi:formamidopyrimidine-DNA glycosylase
MPELPEVESIKLQLQKYLVGHKIEKIEVKNPRLWTGETKDVEGAKVKDVRRFAKVLSIDLDNNHSIVIHIKLTGQILYRGPNLKEVPELSKKVLGGIPGIHTHVIFHLDKGGTLYYNDVRRFGWLKVVHTDKLLEENDFISKLGPEPFKDLDVEKFKEILKRGNRPIKVLIMDQAKMGGIGNIYANDALWLAKINPETKAKEIPEKQMEELFKAIESVLKEGLKYGGSSELAYVTPNGSEGQYQRHTLSYGKEGTTCTRCKKGVFEKYFLGGRGTYICKVCQK